MALLYLDEHLAGFANELRASGHDVITATQEERRGRTDAWHFREGLRSQRIILTWDRRDFEYLHRMWSTLNVMEITADRHAGILTKQAKREYSVAEWLPVVRMRLEIGDDLSGRFLVWHPKIGNWKEDDWRPED